MRDLGAHRFQGGRGPEKRCEEEQEEGSLEDRVGEAREGVGEEAAGGAGAAGAAGAA